MKKCFAFLLALILGLHTIPIYAADSGAAVVTKVNAYLDYTPIRSYMVEGFTYVPVEDLQYYGFYVKYDSGFNTYRVERIPFATPYYTKELWQTATELQESTIFQRGQVQVLLDNEPAQCCTIDGEAYVFFDELAKYGTFKWDGSVSITIFQDELQRELDHAENVVEIAELPRGEQIAADLRGGSYVGQVDENGFPHGVGFVKRKRDLTTLSYLGHFSHGKPHGYIYKESDHTVSRTYTVRQLHFIGSVDGSLEAKREYIYDPNHENDIPKLLRGPNFGPEALPKMEIGYRNGPESPPDCTIYESGCYYEHWDGKNGRNDYRIWKDQNFYSKTITVSNLCFSGGLDAEEYPLEQTLDTWRAEKLPILATESFTEYTSEYLNRYEKTYSNGFVHTRSQYEDDYSPIVRNDPQDGARYYPFDISVSVKGEELEFDVSPTMENDRVLVPLRAIAEALNTDVSWDGTTKTITVYKGGSSVTMQIDNPTMLIVQVDSNFNRTEQSVTLDVPPKLTNSRTLVPIRAISEGFGAEVLWDDTIKQVVINAKK